MRVRTSASGPRAPRGTPVVIYGTWDEGSSTLKMPFIAIGPGVKTNYTGTVSYTHSSLVKSIDAILGLSTLSKVSGANDLSDLFQAGQYP